MKSAIKAVILLTFSFGLLAFMNQAGLLDVKEVFRALQRDKALIATTALLQVVLVFVLVVRYFLVTRVCGITAPFSQVMAATFVSAAVGQWAPGSLAVTEFLRVGLMLGSRGSSVSVVTTAGESSSSVPTQLAVASLFDRLLGFFTILSTGFVACSLILFLKGQAGVPEKTTNWPLLILAGCSLSGAVLIALLPALSNATIVRRLVTALEGGCGRHIGAGVVGQLAKIGKSVFAQVASILDTVTLGAREPARFALPFFLSVLCVFLSSFTLYLSAFAVGGEIRLAAIVAAFPVIALSALLPISFGGMGGQQLVAVAVFHVFDLDATTVSSASLLQNGLLLAVNTFLGILFAQLSIGQIRSIVLRRRQQTI